MDGHECEYAGGMLFERYSFYQGGVEIVLTLWHANERVKIAKIKEGQYNDTYFESGCGSNENTEMRPEIASQDSAAVMPCIKHFLFQHNLGHLLLWSIIDQVSESENAIVSDDGKVTDIVAHSLCSSFALGWSQVPKYGRDSFFLSVSQTRTSV